MPARISCKRAVNDNVHSVTVEFDSSLAGDPVKCVCLLSREVLIRDRAVIELWTAAKNTKFELCSSVAG